MKTIYVVALVPMLGLSLILVGCGGGAVQAPTITAKPKGTAKVADAGTQKTGGGPKTNGKPATGGTGDLIGVIKFNGAAPAGGRPKGFDPADPKTDMYCVKNGASIVDESLIVDPTTKGLKNVIIYLAKAPSGYSRPKEVKEVVFDQKNCVFVPHVLPVLTGQTIKILNSDMTTHNTHTYPTRNPGYSKALGFGLSDPISYQSAEAIPVKVGCDFHGWMSAFHVPLDHHFVGVTNEKGEFSIKGLPAGVHRIRIWHEKAGYLEREYEMTIEGGENKLELSYEPAKFATFTGPKPKTVILSALK